MKASPMVWTGRVLSALFVLFMLGASVAPKFLMPDANLDYFRSLNIDPAAVSYTHLTLPTTPYV